VKDRSLTGLLAMYDGIAPDLARQKAIGGGLLDQIYGDTKPDGSGREDERIKGSAFLPARGRDEQPIIVYSFGWSSYGGRLVRSYSHDWYTGPHSKRCLERNNPDDWRLKDWTGGLMEQVAGVAAELEAHSLWEDRWREVLRYDQGVITAFTDHLARERQLWSRRHFYLGQMGRLVRGRLREADNGNDIYTLRRDRNDQMGPVIEIEDRTFFFEGENLREGMPWRTFHFDGSETPVPDERRGWWPESEGKHGLKTQQVRRYLTDKRRTVEVRERRERKEDEAAANRHNDKT
jgi:hypothetical protein